MYQEYATNRVNGQSGEKNQDKFCSRKIGIFNYILTIPATIQNKIISWKNIKYLMIYQNT